MSTFKPGQDIKEAGLKVTQPRIKILEIFEKSFNRHLSADDVYKSLITSDSYDIGIATVYRVLTQFAEAEILTRHNFDGGHAIFELNSGDHHDHLLCTKCGSVFEFFDQQIEDRQQKLADDLSFDITDHSLTIYGLCKSCK
jgi:Fur family ferric uptake transcriptional regulator